MLNATDLTMTSYSKYFKIMTENATCADFVHCGNSCFGMFRWNALNIGYGCCKYIGPISVVIFIKKMNRIFEIISFWLQIPILLKFRELNADVLKQCCSKFLEYLAAAWLMSVAGISFMCFY